MKTLKAFILFLTCVAANGAATDIQIPQRNASDRNEFITIQGITNPWEAVGFNASGILQAVPLWEMTPAANKLAGRALVVNSGGTDLEWANLSFANIANNFTAAQTISVNGAVSTPPLSIIGSVFTGGTSTTTRPQFIIEPAGTTSTNWSTGGTLLGANAPSGFSGNIVDFQLNNVSKFLITGTQTVSNQTLNCAGNVQLTSAALNFNIGSDTFLTRDAAASWQSGTDSATPIAQTFKGSDSRGGTDTNVAGGALTIAAGRGTGNASGGNLALQTSVPQASGTTQGIYLTREFYFGGEKSIAESTASTVVNITLGAGKYIGGTLTATTHADDGTDYQAVTEYLIFSAVNKAGVVTPDIQRIHTQHPAAVSAGTLTDTWTIVANGNSVDIKNNAVSSLTQTSLKVSYKLTINGDATSIITP